jgi:hypothetical protein
LLANGVHLVGRSFKYHRPRGIMAAGPEDPNALVTVRRDAGRYTPNLNAAQVELYDGLIAESQNRWPRLEFDCGRVNDYLSRFLPAGFYYKTFMWPRSAASVLEPRIRAAAGPQDAHRRSQTRPLRAAPPTATCSWSGRVGPASSCALPLAALARRYCCAMNRRSLVAHYWRRATS